MLMFLSKIVVLEKSIPIKGTDYIEKYFSLAEFDVYAKNSELYLLQYGAERMRWLEAAYTLGILYAAGYPSAMIVDLPPPLPAPQKRQLR